MVVVMSTEKFKIKIKDNVIKILNSNRQIDKNSKESGGILIGYETLNNDIVIEYITQPLKLDKRQRYAFYRKDKKHNEILNNIWKNKGNIHTYIGEWHTHPESYPDYSSKDEKNWKDIGEKINKDIFIHIIVGICSIGIWQYDNKVCKIIKIGDIYEVFD